MAADPPPDGSNGRVVRCGSQTEVDPGGVPPGRTVIGTAINLYLWGTCDPDSGKKAHDDGDWLEVKGGGGEVWSKGHVYDADHRSGASSLRGGATSKATVQIHITVPPGCTGWGTCSDAITMPWDYCVSGDGIHVLDCPGTGVDITGGTHCFRLSPSNLSSTYRLDGKADRGESQRGSLKGGAGLPSLLKIEVHDEGTSTSSAAVELHVTSSSAKAKSGVFVVPEVTDTKQAEAGICAWEFSSSILDQLSAQALVARADTGLGRFDVLHALQASWAIACDADPSKSHGPHDLGPVPRTHLAPQTTPRVALPDDGSVAGSGSGAGAPSDDGATGKIVAPRGLVSEPGATPGLLFLETDRSAGPALTFALAAAPAGRVRLPETLAVREGDASGSVEIHGIEAGPFTVRATLLDARGLPTPATLLLAGESLSLATLPTPRLSARIDGWHLDDASGRWLALAGGDAGALIVERSGFDGMASASTTLQVETIDPAGVLRALPTTLSIAAGETTVRLPLELQDVAGEAALVVRCDDFVARIAVRSVRQGLECALAGATVPVGGRAVVPVALRVPEGSARAVDVVAGDPAVLSVPVGAAVVELAQGARSAWIAFEARAVGASGLRASSPGVPDLEFPVTVVPAEIAMSRTEVTLSALGPRAEGVLRLRLTEGATWQSASGDATQGVEIVEGAGTATLVVRVAPDPERDAPVRLAVTLAEAPAGAFEVVVDDRVHEERSTYRIDVR